MGLASAMSPSSPFVRRPLFGRATSREIGEEEEAVAADLRRESRLLLGFTLRRSKSGQHLVAASGAGDSPVKAKPGSGSSALRTEIVESSSDDGVVEPLPELPLNIGVRQRWIERGYLFSYIVDFLVGPFYDRVLLPRPGGAKRPVVLVPGWCGRTRSFRKMADRLEKEGYPVYPVPLGSQLGCIDRKATLISKFLDEHKLEDVYVVAHSMGGLITVRSMMKGETRIRKLITMGTPYRGTHVIYLGYAVSVLLVVALGFYLSPLAGTIYLALILQIPSLWQMQPSSTLLRETLAYLARAATPVQCVYAVRDQIVVHNWRDAWSPTRLGREDDLCLPEYGHMNLFMGDSGVALVARLLARYDALLPPTGAAAENDPRRRPQQQQQQQQEEREEEASSKAAAKGPVAVSA